jgi:hypothetical protein
MASDGVIGRLAIAVFHRMPGFIPEGRPGRFLISHI